MSLENYGTAEWFSPDNGSDKIGSFYETISTPLITDMNFSYSEGTSEIVSTGKKNLFAGSDAIILGKYNPETKNILAEISATTRTGDKVFSKEFPVRPKNANAFIPRVWAYTTINSLLDRIEVEGESEPLVSEVTNLALEFGFVTSYTSLFVELPEKTNPYPAEAENRGFVEETTQGTGTEKPAAKDETSEDNSMSSPLSAQSEPASGQSKSYSGESAASSSSYRNSGATQSAKYDGAAGKEKTPGFEMVPALGGLFGTAVLFRNKMKARKK
jgi:PGF-CTERM motif